MTHSNFQLIENFYNAFARRDYSGMIACYAPDIDFADEVFTLQGKRVGGMWHMLCTSGSELQLTHSNVQANDERGSAHWEAHYTFANRPVYNILDAEFRFRDGKIIWHRDHFDFYRWAKMALGPTGLLLGWTPMVKTQVQKTALARLEKFIAAHPEYA